jgi:hypothetical protein
MSFYLGILEGSPASFSALATLARDVLSIPATASGVERLYSSAQMHVELIQAGKYSISDNTYVRIKSWN